MKRDPVKHLRRECEKVLEQLYRIRVLSVPAAAELLDKPREWVRSNFPIIKHSRKSHSVRLCDIEEYQDRRTLRMRNAECGIKSKL
jgi:hypothetical protein